MKTYSAPVLAALAAGEVALVQFIHLAFSPTAISLNTSNWNFTYGGITYKGANGMGEISPINDRAGELQGMKLSFTGGDPANLSLALDDADIIQGTDLIIRTAIIELVNYTILDAPIDWSGKLDTMAISEDGKSATIIVSAENKGVDLLRGTPSFYADADQRAINPTDASFSYIVDQTDKLIPWPARSFFLR